MENTVPTWCWPLIKVKIRLIVDLYSLFFLNVSDVPVNCVSRGTDA